MSLMLDSIEKQYEEALNKYFNHIEEEALYEISEIGKLLVVSKLGPDVLLDIHSKALAKLISRKDPNLMSRIVINANELLLNGIMAYAMNYYNFMDVLEAEKKKLELSQKEISNERNKLDDIISAIDADLLLLDRDMKIIWTNKKLVERPSYSGGDIIGKPCNIAYCNMEKTSKDCPVSLAFNSGKPIQIEHPITYPDGTTRFYSFTCSPIKDNTGIVTNVLELVQDITERKILEDRIKEKSDELFQANIKLKEMDKLKSMFIASMSHELRTPLNAIIGFTGMTIQGLSGDLNEEQKDNLTRAYRSAIHLLQLITNVIDISKIEAGRVAVYPERFVLHELIDEALITIEPQAKAKGLAIEVEVPAGLEMITDQKRLLQCIINYLGNAVKFTEKGKFTVCAREIDGDVEISVIDTGIGIAQTNIPKLFEAFEQLDTHLRVKAGGSGLGLYLTKKMATELLQGSVGVKSIEGKGSTFSIRIPRMLNTYGGK